MGSLSIIFLSPPKEGGYVFVAVFVSVCMSVCLSVCLCAKYLKNYEWILMNYWRNGAWLKVQLITFWWRLGSLPGSWNFYMILYLLSQE